MPPNFVEMPTVHLVIKGTVQGVSYRATAREVARKLGVTGWVKNRKDGSVEANATGSKDQLDKFIEWCGKGPTGSLVTELIIEPIPDRDFDGFVILRH